MRKFKFTILLLVTLFCTQTCAVKTYVDKYNQFVFFKHKYDTYKHFKAEYKWFTFTQYELILQNLDLYEISNIEKNYLTKILIALIDKESWHGTSFTGSLCEVTLYRNGEYVTEYHRARGWMQVMVYNTNLKSYEAYKLYDLETNIYWGIKTFMRGYFKAQGDIQLTLKNYNSGENSDHFNWEYINYIINKANNYKT